MKPEIAKLWIDDLLSGPPQTIGYLQTSEGFCCLGRLCELAMQHGVKLETTPYQTAASTDVVSYNDTSSYLPDEVMEWAGMRTSCGHYNQDQDLSMLNDNGKTFAEIAEVIRSNVDAL